LAGNAYLDFVIEIGEGAGLEYPVSVLFSPAGEARETLRFPFDRLALENHLLRLERALLKSGGKRRQALSPDQQAVRDFGTALFDALFSGEARNRYDVSRERARQAEKGLRIKLRIQDARLAALPWEFLFDPRAADYVCLSNQTPLVRYLELPQPPQPLAVQPPLRILGLIASPSDLPALDVDCEKQRVEVALKDLRANGRVELTWLEGSTWRDLQRALRGGPWHIFHFIGHGGYDPASDQGLVALCDENGRAFRLPADKLGRLLANHPGLRLVLLNACEGARGGESDIFSSAASILVRSGLPAVAAMQYEITDDAAIEFSRSFYEALADGLPVDAAVSEARLAINLSVNNSLEWGTPVLHLRAPDGALFALENRPVQPPSVVIHSDGGTVVVGDVHTAGGDFVGGDKIEQRLRQAIVASDWPAVRQTALERLAVQPDDAGARAALKLAGDELLRQAEVAAQRERLAREREELLKRQTQQSIPAAPRSPTATTGQPTPDDDVVNMALEWLGLSPSGAAAQPPAERTPPMILLLPGDIPLELLRIPAGDFLMGSDRKKDTSARNDESPSHSVYVDEYWIGRCPVTNRQYAAFIQATGYEKPEHWENGRPPAGKEDHPVVKVNCHDAEAFCQWLSRRSGRSLRLPTEAEWEKAARGTDGRIYPWGKKAPDPQRCNFGKNENGTTRVGRYSPQGDSPYGCADMAGNVWEWIQDWYASDYYQHSPERNPPGATASRYRAVRGGSWDSNMTYLRTANRSYGHPAGRSNAFGFRCVVSAKK